MGPRQEASADRRGGELRFLNVAGALETLPCRLNCQSTFNVLTTEKTGEQPGAHSSPLGWLISPQGGLLAITERVEPSRPFLISHVEILRKRDGLILGQSKEEATSTDSVFVCSLFPSRKA